LTAVRQVPIDMERMVDALHVSGDAGEYEAALRALLERIPDGWGRWIQCGAGWYPTSGTATSGFSPYSSFLWLGFA
jgi:hypothetical protein